MDVGGRSGVGPQDRRCRVPPRPALAAPNWTSGVRVVLSLLIAEVARRGHHPSTENSFPRRCFVNPRAGEFGRDVSDLYRLLIVYGNLVSMTSFGKTASAVGRRRRSRRARPGQWQIAGGDKHAIVVACGSRPATDRC
jgi:hypothetical protein